MAMHDKPIFKNDTGVPPRAKALMVLAAVVTLLAIWLVPSDKQEKPPALPEMASPPADTQALPLPPPPTGDSEANNLRSRAGTARAVITELRAGDAEPDPGEVFARAEQMQSDGQPDEAYLLYRFAARQGHAQAALVLGTQADPAFYTAAGSVLPKADPQQAYKWYSAAAAAGNEQAATRLQDLRERVEQSAADGDAAARRLMLQWR